MLSSTLINIPTRNQIIDKFAQSLSSELIRSGMFDTSDRDYTNVKLLSYDFDLHTGIYTFTFDLTTSNCFHDKCISELKLQKYYLDAIKFYKNTSVINING
jgi:hypothetical protein